ncbi:MAG: tagaturonate reductase [Candidatus Heimdallarchaeaceae archaeon]
MKSIIEYQRQYDYPIRIVQFGEGNFLRAFWGKAIDELNKKEIFKGQICVIQPIVIGKLETLEQQDYLYNVCLQDADNEDLVLVESIKTGINPYSDFDSFTEIAKNPDVRIIISNTTEAGIVLDPEDSFDRFPPDSFPGKLLLFLYTRYKEFGNSPGRGLLILPCELIENNGTVLKRILLALVDKFSINSDFKKWLNKECIFFNTLVDGIVTGYPALEEKLFEEKLGYKDQMIVKGETYQLLVIEGDESYRDELPLTEAVLNVIWTKDLDFYRKIKVRIMNGFQTVMSLTGFLSGLNTEREALNHYIIGEFMRNGLYNEIIPTLEYAEEDKLSFAKIMLERLNNPQIEHLLNDINLNSFSKFQSRIQPSIAFWNSDSLPFLMFSTAILLKFYCIEEYKDGLYYANSCGKKYPVYDTPQNLKTLYNLRRESNRLNHSTKEYCSAVLHERTLWLQPLKLSESQIITIAFLMDSIGDIGVVETIKLIKEGLKI